LVDPEQALSQSGGKRYERNALPHGYSAAVNIVGTLLRVWGRTDVSVERMRGLVLIDELEAHLHVKMQKTILPCLMVFFPNVQFIIATHSPFILNSADNAVVFNLDNNKVLFNPEANQGKQLQEWSLDDVLRDMYDVRDT
jgi:predicted ATP-dependent endonuclease of OLD family